jgi:hypothetical protein
MCLINISEKKYATEPIKVYKVIYPRYLYCNKTKTLNNKIFKGIIRGIKTDGYIVVENKKVYFITPLPYLNGSRPINVAIPNGLYSWMLDENVDIESIMVENYPFKDKPLLDYLNLGQYITPFQQSKVSLGTTYSSPIRIEGDCIYEGIHSFVSPNISFECFRNKKHVIVECTIPEGATYYTGMFELERSIASNKLKYPTKKQFEKFKQKSL